MNLKPWDTTVKWGCNSTPTPQIKNPKSKEAKMHWFLIVGLNMNLTESMGAFENKEACEKAGGWLIEEASDIRKKPAYACLEEKSPVLQLFKK